MSCPRERREQAEAVLIGPRGVRAQDSRGRLHPEEPCPVRTCFQRDVDRITHCKAFRRLKHKTQVFLQPEGDHYRTRLTHTLEVARLARTVARALELNEDLTEAIAIGHDLGHTPFGHAGERALNCLHPGGFRHYEQSLRVVDVLERDGRGLNLCYETRMGILNHTHGAPDDTAEAVAVRLCDQVAYLNHDLDDAVRAGILRVEDVPDFIRARVGDRSSRRIDSFVQDIVTYGAESGRVWVSPEMEPVFTGLREFMYENVYRNPVAKGEESKVDGILEGIYQYYIKHTERLPEEYQAIACEEGVHRAVCDYVAGMTDKYAVALYGDIFIPASWQVK